jgi:hypothetical protein
MESLGFIHKAEMERALAEPLTSVIIFSSRHRLRSEGNSRVSRQLSIILFKRKWKLSSKII